MLHGRRYKRQLVCTKRGRMIEAEFIYYSGGIVDSTVLYDDNQPCTSITEALWQLIIIIIVGGKVVEWLEK